MTDSEIPNQKELLDAWSARERDADPEAEQDVLNDRFRETINAIRADTLRIAARACAGGIPMHMTLPQWLELQAQVYVEGQPREFLPEVKINPSSKQPMVTVGKPRLIRSLSPHHGDELVSQTLHGAASTLENSSIFGSTLRATVVETLRNTAHAVWGDAFGNDGRNPGIITLPRPHVTNGPQGISAEVADANYLDKAADDLADFYKPFSAGVRNMVVLLLRNVADEVRALPPKDPS